MPPLNSALTRPGITGIAEKPSGYRMAVGTCARCLRERPLTGRDLCEGCRKAADRAGDLEEYGYVKADRLRDYRLLRSAGVCIRECARRMQVTHRTCQRWEDELDKAGQAPWRRDDPNIQRWSRKRHAARGA
jgi:hypothetical protein